MCSTAAFIGGWSCQCIMPSITDCRWRQRLLHCDATLTVTGPSQREYHPICVRALRWHLTFDPSFSTVIADVIVLLTSIVAESSTPPFFCHSFSRALLRANSCVRQLRVFCFPGSSLNPMGPSHKAAARFGSRSHSLLCAPRKWGKKKEKIQLCLTYMLSGIGFRAGSLADS